MQLEATGVYATPPRKQHPAPLSPGNFPRRILPRNAAKGERLRKIAPPLIEVPEKRAQLSGGVQPGNGGVVYADDLASGIVRWSPLGVDDVETQFRSIKRRRPDG